MNFRQFLADEFSRRRDANRRYSLRAFARDLETDHASLSQILRGRRALSPAAIRKFGRILRVPRADIVAACTEQNAETLLQLARAPGFRPNSRWIATRSGLPLDAVNTALHHLIHGRRLVLHAPDKWTVAS